MSGAGMTRLLGLMRFRECVARSSGKVTDAVDYKRQMQAVYLNNVEDFKESDKRELRSLIRGESGLANERLKFIKLRPGIDWDFPYTVDDCIVLPHEFLSKGNKTAAKTLVHESIHIRQRRNQEGFDAFYQQPHAFPGIRYIKAARVDVPESIASRTVTNPDAADDTWICKIFNRDYWFCMTVDDDSELPGRWAYTAVDEGSGVFRVTHERKPTHSLADHLQGFDSATSPNELFAYSYSTGLHHSSSPFMITAKRLLS